MTMYNNILLAYDFDNSFTNVPKEIESLAAGRDNVTVTLYNVISEAELQSSVRYNNKHLEDIAEEKEHQLHPFIEELEATGVSVNVKFSSGPIKQTLLKELKDSAYDIIVMSNKRDNANLGNVLGNVTHKIANSAEIPVLIIK